MNFFINSLLCYSWVIRHSEYPVLNIVIVDKVNGLLIVIHLFDKVNLLFGEGVVGLAHGRCVGGGQEHLSPNRNLDVFQCDHVIQTNIL